MIHGSAIAESIVAPTLFRPTFSHSLDPKRTSDELKSTAVENRVRCTENQGFPYTPKNMSTHPGAPLAGVAEFIGLDGAVVAC